MLSLLTQAGLAVERKRLKMVQGMVGSLLPHKDEIYLRCLLHWAKDFIRSYLFRTVPVHHHPPLWPAQSHESSDRLKQSISPRAEKRLFFFKRCCYTETMVCGN